MSCKKLYLFIFASTFLAIGLFLWPRQGKSVAATLEKKTAPAVKASAPRAAESSKAVTASQPAVVVQPAQAVTPVLQANPGVSPVTQGAVQSGVLACVSRINQITNFLTNNIQSGAFLFIPQNGTADQSLISTSLELVRQDRTTLYASSAFAPNQANGCGAVYETVEYGKASCPDMEKSLFSNLRRVGPLRKDIISLDAGAVKVFLMPAGTGCVVIKKEVVQ